MAVNHAAKYTQYVLNILILTAIAINAQTAKAKQSRHLLFPNHK